MVKFNIKYFLLFFLVALAFKTTQKEIQPKFHVEFQQELLSIYKG